MEVIFQGYQYCLILLLFKDTNTKDINIPICIYMYIYWWNQIYNQSSNPFLCCGQTPQWFWSYGQTIAWFNQNKAWFDQTIAWFDQTIAWFDQTIGWFDIYCAPAPQSSTNHFSESNHSMVWTCTWPPTPTGTDPPHPLGWKNLLRYHDIHLRRPAAGASGCTGSQAGWLLALASAGDRHGNLRCQSSGDLASHCN